ncbi:hypothetical protein GM50_8645, partial [freshwater metagenome]
MGKINLRHALSFFTICTGEISAFPSHLSTQQVWVTDPNHSDRRLTWPQQRKLL